MAESCHHARFPLYIGGPPRIDTHPLDHNVYVQAGFMSAEQTAHPAFFAQRAEIGKIPAQNFGKILQRSPCFLHGTPP